MTAGSDVHPFPNTIGPYQVRKRLGAGGMGEVFLAHDPRLDRLVAIKRIRAEPEAIDEVRLQRLRREAKMAARLNHPAIVQIYDLLTVEGLDHIVMEMVPGSTLRRLLAPGPLGVRRGLDLAEPITAALAFAHGKGVVHRDLKTENVLITEEGGPKLADFGLARPNLEVADGSTTDPSLTHSGAILGTYRTMAPEQARGEFDARSDLFSLGVLFYETFTGASPFLDRTPLTTLMRLVRDPHRPPRELAPDLPISLANLIDHLLAKDPDQRPQTAAAVLESLHAIQATLPTLPQQSMRGGTSTWYPGPGPLAAPDDPTRLPASSKPTAKALKTPYDPRMVEHPSPSTAPDTALADPSTRRLKAERRQVTLLMGELSLAESNAATGQVPDPEVLFEIGPELQARTRETLDRFEGFLADFSGHRLLAYFGFPVAHEDDARRAVLAGQQLIQEALSVHSPGLPALTFRVGLHTTTAIATTEGSAETALTLGSGLDRVQATLVAAPAGEISLGAATRRLVDTYFETSPAGEVQVPGAGPAEPVFRLVANNAGLSRTHTLVRSPLVGRERELDLLIDRHRRAQGGQGVSVLVRGEAGIGKSRLLQALERRLGSEVPWSFAHATPYTQGTPLHPLVGLLERLFELDPEEEAEARLSRLDEALTNLDLPTDEVGYPLRPLLRLPPNPDFAGLSPDRQRQALLDALLSVLLEGFGQQPRVLVFEDLHWADPTTLELVGSLLEHLSSSSLLLLLTSRPGLAAPWLQQSDLTQLSLERLLPEEMETLVSQLEGKELQLPSALRRQLVDKAEGLPLFGEELMRSIEAMNAAKGGAFDPTTSSLRVPETLRDSLTARLDRLGRGKELAQIAAVVGREISPDLLEALLDPSTAIHLANHLDSLVAAEIFERRGFGRRRRFRFRHALLRDAAYESLLVRRRVDLHGQIADVLGERFPDRVAQNPEELARHQSAGGRPLEASDSWLLAGQLALTQSALSEATRHLERGLEDLSEAPQTEDRLRREVAIRLALGSTASASDGFADPGVEHQFLRAEALLGRLGDDPQLFQVWHGLWSFHMVRANLELARDLGRKMLSMADAAEASELQIEALYALALIEVARGELVEARTLLERIYSLSPRAVVDLGRRTFVTEVSSRASFAFLLWVQGHPDRALEINREGRAIAREAGHPFSLTSVLTHGAWLSQLRGEGDEARRLIDEARVLASEKGFALLEVQSAGLRAWIDGLDPSRQAGEGEIFSGQANLENAVASSRKIGALFSLTMSLGMLAEAMVRRGAIEPARQVVDEALDLVDQTGERTWEADLWRLRAECLAHDGSPDTGAAFDRALEIAEAQGALSFVLRAATSRARWHLDEARAEDEGGLLERTCARFEEGLETADRRTADALVQELAAATTG